MNKFAKDFRRAGKEAVKPKLGIAMLASIIVSFLGGSGASSPSFNFNFELPSSSGEEISSMHFAFDEFINEIMTEQFAIILFALLGLILLIVPIFAFFLGGVSQSVAVGHARFNLGLIDKTEVKFEQLFFFFPKYFKACFVSLLCGLIVFVGSLLFIVPGIIAGYSLSMVPYILAENPELKPLEAMKKSHEIMQGNRWRLFCLGFSYIGWDIVAALTFGIYNLWLNPYKAAARADFYREVSGTRIYSEEDLATRAI